MSNCLSIKAGPVAVIVSRCQPDKEDQLEPAQNFESVCKPSTFVSIRVDTHDFYAEMSLIRIQAKSGQI
ncbi:hypothetical protein DAPPUDRAFT_238645 [Daphnia pulex]|uniref:Uncharacterized protein n=1 Tax=Daphnia pulex TaxID=6669 RepID=E9G704_DAPPU|nr:hypothetical protein DAPPUDRAFT_238645 [Daphnia pulex]|eukprot:EFX84374.1 hypothetical protein DAPPUDRAFT_238645 [Daphnia pulex]